MDDSWRLDPRDIYRWHRGEEHDFAAGRGASQRLQSVLAVVLGKVFQGADLARQQAVLPDDGRAATHAGHRDVSALREHGHRVVVERVP